MGKRGRPKGAMNRKYLPSGAFIPRFKTTTGQVIEGMKITPKKYKKLVSDKNKANYKIEKQLKESMKNTPSAYEDYKAFGKNTDVSSRRKGLVFSGSQFRTEKSSKRYAKNLKDVASGKYLQRKQVTLFNNYRTMIQNVGETSSEANRLVNRINHLGIEKFDNLIINGDVDSIAMFGSDNKDDVEKRIQVIHEQLDAVMGIEYGSNGKVIPLRKRSKTAQKTAKAFRS